jgi:hypothetical protein
MNTVKISDSSAPFFYFKDALFVASSPESVAAGIDKSLLYEEMVLSRKNSPLCPHAIKEGAFEAFSAYCLAEKLLLHNKEQIGSETFVAQACSDPFFLLERMPPEHRKELLKISDMQDFISSGRKIFSFVSPMSRTFLNTSSALAQLMIKYKLDGHSACYSGNDSFAQLIDDAFFRLQHGLSANALLFGAHHFSLNSKAKENSGHSAALSSDAACPVCMELAASFFISAESADSNLCLRHSETISFPDEEGFRVFLETVPDRYDLEGVDILIHNDVGLEQNCGVKKLKFAYSCDTTMIYGCCFALSAGLNLREAMRLVREKSKLSHLKSGGSPLSMLVLSRDFPARSLHIMLLEEVL